MVHKEIAAPLINIQLNLDYLKNARCDNLIILKIIKVSKSFKSYHTLKFFPIFPQFLNDQGVLMLKFSKKSPLRILNDLKRMKEN